MHANVGFHSQKVSSKKLMNLISHLICAEASHTPAFKNRLKEVILSSFASLLNANIACRAADLFEFLDVRLYCT